MKKLDGSFLRPLLGLSKAQLLQYMHCRDLPWREDASNLSRKYKRNQVRLDLLPLMGELAGGGEALASRLAHMVVQSEDLRGWLDVEVSIST
jgi:tRNA(Ile)-lysidine synthase